MPCQSWARCAEGRKILGTQSIYLARLPRQSGPGGKFMERSENGTDRMVYLQSHKASFCFYE